MQHSDRTVFVGMWWLPDQPEQQIPGTLTIGPGHPELELHHSSAARSMPRGEDRFDPPVLHGRSMGASLTLWSNTQIGSSTSRDRELQETHRDLVVGTVLVGDTHLADEADTRFNRASLRLSNLDQWVNRTPYQRSSLDTVQLIDLPELQAAIPGCNITLRRDSVTLFNRLTDSGFTSHEVIDLSFDEAQPLDELEYRFLRPLEQLLTLATGQACTAYELEVGNYDGSDDDMLANWPLAVFTVRRRNTDMAQTDRPMIRPHMRFGMNDPSYPPNIDFSEFTPRWYALQSTLGTVCDLIFSLRSDNAGYLQQQMFTIASALEGLHRSLNPQMEKMSTEDKARNKEVLALVKQNLPAHHEWLGTAIAYAFRKSYAYRIRELLADTDHLMADVVGDETAWVKQLRDIRDGIGHVLPTQDAKTVEQMIAMLHSARLFAELVLLRRLGFTDPECRRSLQHHWELDNVREHVTKGYPAWFPPPSATVVTRPADRGDTDRVVITQVCALSSHPAPSSVAKLVVTAEHALLQVTPRVRRRHLTAVTTGTGRLRPAA